MDEFLQDMNAIANRLETYTDSLDGQRIAEMAACIRQHNWDAASSLIAQWSVQDEPDWSEIPDPFYGGYSHV